MGLRSCSILAYGFGSMAAGAIAGVARAPMAAQVVGLTGITLVLVLAVLAPRLRGGREGTMLWEVAARPMLFLTLFQVHDDLVSPSSYVASLTIYPA